MFRKSIHISFAGGLMIMLAALSVTAEKAAAQTAEKVPASINPKIMQFNPKDLKIEYLAPSDKVITQESLTADSLKLVKYIDIYNKRQATPDGWVGKSSTAEDAYSMINDKYENFLIDKVRYFVSTGQIPKPPLPPPGETAQMKLGRDSMFAFPQ